MGWIAEAPPWPGNGEAHEGYVIGFVRIKGEWQQASALVLQHGAKVGGDVVDLVQGFKVDRVAVECTCGFRTPMLFAPIDARWAPSHVDLDDEAEELARRLWRRHIDADVRGLILSMNARNTEPDPSLRWRGYPKLPDQLSGRFLFDDAREAILDRKIAARRSTVIDLASRRVK